MESDAGRRRYGDDQRRQRNVWAFTFQRDGSLTGNRLLIQFPDFGMDGMRCDVDGAFTSPAAARVRWPWFRRHVCRWRMGRAAGGQGRCERRGGQQGKAAQRWAAPS